MILYETGESMISMLSHSKKIENSTKNLEECVDKEKLFKALDEFAQRESPIWLSIGCRIMKEKLDEGKISPVRVVEWLRDVALSCLKAEPPSQFTPGKVEDIVNAISTSTLEPLRSELLEKIVRFYMQYRGYLHEAESLASTLREDVAEPIFEEIEAIRMADLQVIRLPKEKTTLERIKEKLLKFANILAHPIAYIKQQKKAKEMEIERMKIIRQLKTPFYNYLDRGDYSNAALIALQVASYDERISGSMMREVIQESFKSGDPEARTNAEEVWSRFLKRRT
jgi:hypothetical protein